MGEVWEARDERLDRTVALKLLAAEQEPDPNIAARTLQEGRALALLDHPAIVRVYHCDRLDPSGVYLAMELVDGESMRDWLGRKGGRIDWPTAIGIGQQIATAMAYVHGQNMCARKSWHQPAGGSPVRGNRDDGRTALCCDGRSSSWYRVLRAARSRGRPRSVDRECAGRNAKGVKGLSPVKHPVPWWPSVYVAAKAASTGRLTVGTTGVVDHGMYTRLMSEPGRSPRGGAQTSQCFLAAGQGATAKFAVSARGEVRSRHSSEEVG